MSKQQTMPSSPLQVPLSGKGQIIQQFQELFVQNLFLSSYSYLANEQIFDGIFNTYIKCHLGKVDINDFETIQTMLEDFLQVKLNEYVCYQELQNFHELSKLYIQTLLSVNISV